MQSGDWSSDVCSSDLFIRAPGVCLSRPQPPAPRAPARPPAAFRARGREAVLQTGVGLKAKPAQQLETRSTDRPQPLFQQSRRLLGFTQRFRDFFLMRRVSIRVATARGRQMSLPPAAALLAAGRRGGSGAGLERFPRGSTNGCASGPSVGLTRPARPRTRPARPLTCPRPAPHLLARPAPAPARAPRLTCRLRPEATPAHWSPATSFRFAGRNRRERVRKGRGWLFLRTGRQGARCPRGVVDPSRGACSEGGGCEATADVIQLREAPASQGKP